MKSVLLHYIKLEILVKNFRFHATIRCPFLENFPILRFDFKVLNSSINCLSIGLTGETFLGRPLLIVRGANFIRLPAFA
jgi:hypothetical protein